VRNENEIIDPLRGSGGMNGISFYNNSTSTMFNSKDLVEVSIFVEKVKKENKILVEDS
jgi:hypothetical protein